MALVLISIILVLCCRVGCLSYAVHSTTAAATAIAIATKTTDSEFVAEHRQATAAVARVQNERRQSNADSAKRQ
jgi:hypothetical protein